MTVNKHPKPMPVFVNYKIINALIPEDGSIHEETSSDLVRDEILEAKLFIFLFVDF